MGVSAAQGSAGLKPGVCTSTTRPSNPFEGQMIYETDTDLTYIYGGTAWQQVSGGTAVGNSGLVYVTSATIGSGVSTATVSSAFNSTYDNYQIHIIGVLCTATSTNLSCAVGSATTAYYQNGYYQTYASATLNGNPYNNTRSDFEIAFTEATNTVKQSVIFDLLSPNLVANTRVRSTFATQAYNGITNGTLQDTTQHTSFIIRPNSGTMTGGTITVYGYRKA